MRRPRGRRILRGVGYLVSVGALALSGIILVALFNQHQKQKNFDKWPKVEAVVAGFEFRQVRHGNRLPAVPENKPVFRYRLKGKTLFAEGDTSSATRIGQRRTIAYDPSDPLKIQVGASAGVRDPLKWVLIVCALLLSGGFILLRLRHSSIGKAQGIM